MGASFQATPVSPPMDKVALQWQRPADGLTRAKVFRGELKAGHVIKTGGLWLTETAWIEKA
jgi:hypothetical protein